MSGAEKKAPVPSAPTPPATTGNLLSSVAPPLELPSFVMAANVQPTVVPPTLPPSQPLSGAAAAVDQMAHMAVSEETFSPAIPLSKGQPVPTPASAGDSQASHSAEPVTPDVDRLGDIMPGSGILTWMKGAVSSGGILQKVAEKAKSSVDSMITTLDPQMKEYLNSGGDIHVVVASDKDVKIQPVREAFQAVFGKATVTGHPSSPEITAVQPTGYSSALAAAKQRIASVRARDVTNHVPVVSIEGFLQEAMKDRWYEHNLLILSQPSLGVELHVQSQGTPVPAAVVAVLRDCTSASDSDGGFSKTVGEVMAENLQVPRTDWQEAVTGVSRRELLLLAAKALAGNYKKMLEISAAER